MTADVDVLYVASGTTAGLRRADSELVAALRELDVSVELVTPDLSPPGWARRWVNRSLGTIDAFESWSLRRATTRALKTHTPRAILFGSTHGALLQPRRRMRRRRVAIRFDTPARLSRPGARYAAEHVLERRRFKAATVLLPCGVTHDPQLSCPPNGQTPVVPLPIPVQAGGDAVGRARDAVVVFYAGSPHKKGLDRAVAAWSAVPASGRRLLITGIPREEGLQYLERLAVPVPPGIEWLGPVEPDRHREITRRAEICLSAARYENYGIVQLEALADGALLVSSPSPGPFAALPIARELEPRLVARTEMTDDLAVSLIAALELDPTRRDAYRQRASELIRPFSREHARARLRDEVLPLLLGQPPIEARSARTNRPSNSTRRPDSQSLYPGSRA